MHAFDTTLVVAAVVAVIASGLVAWLLRAKATAVVEEEAALALEAA